MMRHKTKKTVPVHNVLDLCKTAIAKRIQCLCRIAVRQIRWGLSKTFVSERKDFHLREFGVYGVFLMGKLVHNPFSFCAYKAIQRETFAQLYQHSIA